MWSVGLLLPEGRGSWREEVHSCAQIREVEAHMTRAAARGQLAVVYGGGRVLPSPLAHWSGSVAALIPVEPLRIFAERALKVCRDAGPSSWVEDRRAFRSAVRSADAFAWQLWADGVVLDLRCALGLDGCTLRVH
jgi:hypothetical protein